RATVRASPFGVGGLTLPGRGYPVSSDLLAAELVRMGTDFTFLRRSFTADMAGRDPFVEVPLLLDTLDRLRAAGPAAVAASRSEVVAAVTGAVPVHRDPVALTA
ncbi:MAG: hypothetical protein ACLGI3_06930, partial [Actinomycetes bacterium]